MISKKLLAMVLCFVMVLGTMSTVAFAAIEEPVAVELEETEPTMVANDGIAATITNESSSKNKSFDDIDDAFAALEEGDTITIAAGTHYLNKSDEWHPRNAEFWLPKDVTIIGEEGAVIQREPYFYATNLTVKNVDFMGYSYVAMVIHGKARFEDCTMIGPNGIYYSTVTEKLEFINCTVKGDVYGLHVGEGTGDVIIDGCTVAGWNTYGNVGVVEISNTDFLDDSPYAFLGFYHEANIKDSTFEPGMTIAAQNPETADIKLSGCTVTDGSSISSVLDDETKDSIVISAAKVGDTYYDTLTEAVAEANGSDIIIFGGEYKWPTNISGNKTFNLKAAEGETVVFEMDQEKPNLNGANVNFEGITFNWHETSDYKGLQHAGNLSYTNCVINGKVFLYGTSETFTGCEFNQDVVDYNVWTYGADVTDFIGCTFNCKGKAVYIYNEGAGASTVNVTNCDFIGVPANDGKAAIEMYTYGGEIYLTIDDETTATGFDEGSVSGNILWNDKSTDDKYINTTHHDIIVKVDDEIVYARTAEPSKPVVAISGDKIYTDMATAISEIADNSTLVIFEGEYDNILKINKKNVTVKAVGDVKFTQMPEFWGKNFYIEGIDFEYVSGRGMIKNGGDGTLKDCTFTAEQDTMRYCYLPNAGSLVIDGCIFDVGDPTMNYWALHFDGLGGSNITIKDSAFDGRIAIGADAGDINISGTDFTGMYVNTYSDVSYEDCYFDVDYVFVGYQGKAVATFDNCEVEGGLKIVDILHSSSESTTVVEDGVITTIGATIGEEIFPTIQAALDSLAGKDGDYEIILAPGTYTESFIVKQEAGLNVTIKAENKGDVVMKGTIVLDGDRKHTNTETLNIENLVFDASDLGEHYFIKEHNAITGDSKVVQTYPHNVTVANCDFIGNGQGNAAPVVGFKAKASYNLVFDGCTAKDMHSFVQAASSVNPLTVKNSTFTNMAEGVINAVNSPKVTFTGNYVETDGYAIRTGQNNVDTYTAAEIIIEDNTIYADTALALRNAKTTATMNNNEIIAKNVFTLDDADDSTINGVPVVATNILERVGETNIVIPSNITIGFEEVEEGLFNIVLSAHDDIYEVVGAELTFTNTSETFAHEYMKYEILGIPGLTNPEKNIDLEDTYALRLVDGAKRMCGTKIIIGQVKFHGQGYINFNVKVGKVAATEYGTNLGMYYTLDEDDVTEDTLVAKAITNGVVEEVKKNVIVNVAYNHKLVGGYWNDDMITVTLKDGFGNVFGPFDISDRTQEFENVQLGRLTVTIEAPGFRKYVYNTTLEAEENGEAPLVLNFWNEVKRDTVQSPLAEIESGKSGLEAHNFLVGDIVMDYKVDEYDLAAVTSYYGSYDIDKAEAEKYIKYDLNRDGNIDIIDVQYVLHTLNN